MRCHILFTHAFSVLRCVFEEITLVDQTTRLSLQNAMQIKHSETVCVSLSLWTCNAIDPKFLFYIDGKVLCENVVTACVALNSNPTRRIRWFPFKTPKFNFANLDRQRLETMYSPKEAFSPWASLCKLDA